jgi:8-oxo-dGTP pyrophosphatase MutT (NUDIX family)
LDVGTAHPYYRLKAPDWANVLPVTFDGKAIMIRQMRAGSMKMTLEVPGGVVDAAEGRDPMMAAIRELEEETGFTSQRVLPLGAINPNPAIMTNKCHFFLALSCVPNPDRKHFPDAEESIETLVVPVGELDQLVRTGQVDHALSALCIQLGLKYLAKFTS